MFGVNTIGTGFQSTPPARGATSQADRLERGRHISIHAPREGGDINAALEKNYRVISIHAPREGGDAPKIANDILSTHFNPRPPRGGRLPSQDTTIPTWSAISIHAPREGGDLAVFVP